MTSSGASIVFSIALSLGSGVGELAGQAVDIKNTIGVLSLTDSGPEPDSIRFYNPDGTAWYVFTFLYDDRNGVWPFVNKDFEPLAFHPDYFVLALAVTRRDSGGYEVVVNQKTGLRKHLPAMPSLRLQSWAEHVLSVQAL